MDIKRVAIIDYGMGNIWSVSSALKYLGVEAVLVTESERLIDFDYVILPGVGSFKKGMEKLQQRGFDVNLHKVAKRGTNILGICLGMQLLGSHSTEDGNTGGLGLVCNKIEKFNFTDSAKFKIPHVGFNSVSVKDGTGLFNGLPESADFYFTHSYRMSIENFEGNYVVCNYGTEFLAAFEYGNICGTQFHPEKSQTNGLVLLKNFLSKK
jgi:glutamine amidotransferase